MGLASALRSFHDVQIIRVRCDEICFTSSTRFCRLPPVSIYRRSVPHPLEFSLCLHLRISLPSQSSVHCLTVYFFSIHCLFSLLHPIQIWVGPDLERRLAHSSLGSRGVVRSGPRRLTRAIIPPLLPPNSSRRQKSRTRPPVLLHRP